MILPPLLLGSVMLEKNPTVFFHLLSLSMITVLHVGTDIPYADHAISQSL
jgi:hypothetical protein